MPGPGRPSPSPVGNTDMRGTVVLVHSPAYPLYVLYIYTVLQLHSCSSAPEYPLIYASLHTVMHTFRFTHVTLMHSDTRGSNTNISTYSGNNKLRNHNTHLVGMASKPPERTLGPESRLVPLLKAVELSKVRQTAGLPSQGISRAAQCRDLFLSEAVFPRACPDSPGWRRIANLLMLQSNGSKWLKLVLISAECC